MRFQIHRASQTRSIFDAVAPIEGAIKKADRGWEVEIETLDDLLALYDRAKADLIVDRQSIWIYDDYME